MTFSQIVCTLRRAHEPHRRCEAGSLVSWCSNCGLELGRLELEGFAPPRVTAPVCKPALRMPEPKRRLHWLKAVHSNSGKAS